MVTAKQRAASRRNIKKAQASRRRSGTLKRVRSRRTTKRVTKRRR